MHGIGNKVETRIFLNINKHVNQSKLCRQILDMT